MATHISDVWSILDSECCVVHFNEPEFVLKVTRKKTFTMTSYLQS